MSTSSIADAQRLLPLEKHAERGARSVLRGTAFTDCLKIIGLAPALEILTAEGKTITMRGSDNYDSGTWKKILASINQQEHSYQQTERGEHLAGQDKARLLHEHTTRYRALSAEADLAWFERVIILAMTRHSMEQQYDASDTQGLETFADPRVARGMSNRLMLNHVVKETTRLVHHIVREPTLARQLVGQCYEEHDRQMQARSLVTREPLPALPPGAISPCAFLAQKEEERHA
jgi:hypothetical protein